MRTLSSISLFLVLLIPLAAREPTPVEIAPAINALGLDLYRQQIKTAGGQGVLLSPYSIAMALAMTYAGADGETKTEMQRVLRLPTDSAVSSVAFEALATQLNDVARESERHVAQLKENGGDATPLQLSVANRLFAQQGYALRRPFLAEVRKHFGSEVELLDFKNDAAHTREVINGWVAAQARDRIRDLLPEDAPSRDARLALVNALYLKAAWEDEFHENATKPEPFHFGRSLSAPVPTMLTQRKLGYAKRAGYSVVTLPYETGRLQFVLFVPDAVDGLAKLEAALTAEGLGKCADLDRREVILHLPKFKLAPATMSLGDALQALGLKTAFDVPKRSANFDRMAPRKPDDYLYIGQVFHKTWLSLDEHGTEAAAATAVMMMFAGSATPRDEPPPVEVRADRPFLFAIQHVDSGACLFLGRVTDPRRE
ncbi:MAG: serpin family protein [Opitutae bacterium]|nr:serpin family protein [Opitutae bacterium]